jgi:molybdopterin-binding protein
MANLPDGRGQLRRGTRHAGVDEGQAARVCAQVGVPDRETQEVQAWRQLHDVHYRKASHPARVSWAVRFLGHLQLIGHNGLSPMIIKERNAMKLSARNQIPARVTGITAGEAIANVELDANGIRLVASVTVEAVRQLGLQEGSDVTAIIKASEVILATGD